MTSTDSMLFLTIRSPVFLHMGFINTANRCVIMLFSAFLESCQMRQKSRVSKFKSHVLLILDRKKDTYYG